MAFDTTVVDDDLTVEPYEEAEEVEASEEPEQEEVETQEPEQADADDVEEEAQDEPDSKPKKGAAARIQQLIAEKKAAEAELERLRQESQQPKQAKSSPDGAPVAPDINDFDLDTEDGLNQYFEAQSQYESERSEWEFDQKLAKREQMKLQQQREQEITNQFKQRFDTNPKFKQDFEQLATVMQDKPINADPSQLYQGEELMDLLEAVAADIDLYYEIASLPEQAQYAKFGEIQASIKARKAPGSKNIRQSRAPRPPNHTKSNAPITRSDYDKSDDDFLAARGL